MAGPNMIAGRGFMPFYQGDLMSVRFAIVNAGYLHGLTSSDCSHRCLF
jgi:hypothetical protein